MRKTFLSLLVSLSALAALAQYSIDWSTIDGGGGTSTGGVYSVSGIPHCGTSPMPAGR